MRPNFLVNASDKELVFSLIAEHRDEIAAVLIQTITKNHPGDVDKQDLRQSNEEFLDAVNGLMFPNETGRIRAVIMEDVEQQGAGGSGLAR